MVLPLKKSLFILFTQLISCHDNLIVLRIKETWQHRFQDGNLVRKDRMSHLISQIQLILIKHGLII